jgi:two-component system, cell cycle sensor histidine kinase and response regulator CckA
VENILEVFWMVDLKTNTVLYVSPGYATIWGRSCESLYASANSWDESIHELDRERIVTAAKRRVGLQEFDESYRIVRPDGTMRWVRNRAFPVPDKAGAAWRMVGVAEDITEEKRRDEQLLRSQRLESLGMLAAGIAHDFNNILAPISLVAPLLRTSSTSPSDLRLLDTLEKCAGRGASLVRQILGFGHGIGGDPRLVQVKHLLDDIVIVITETFPKSVVFRHHVPNNLWPIVANPTQIHQVLLNLCVNARDAMPQGGTLQLRAMNLKLDATAAAAIEGARPGAWLVLHVEDSGTGIPPEVLEHIWKPFFTTKSAEQGTGLGLSTVRGIVDTHHGFITLATRPGSTTFSVYLPADTSGVTVGTNPGLPSAAAGQSELILLVDDEEPIRDLARSILTKAGYRVLTAANGREAARLFQDRSAEIALVITDRDMPLIDGVGLARTIHLSHPATKILLMSGTRSRVAVSIPKAVRSDDNFIGKPFTAHTLLAAVAKLLRRPTA